MPSASWSWPATLAGCGTWHDGGMSTASVASAPALWDPDVFVDGPPHEFLAELRRTQPVYWQDMPDEPGFWAVLTHADLTAVAREPVLYSASEGGVVLENLEPENLEQMRGMLLAMDPPKHVAYRRPLAPSFKARVIGSLEGRIRTICREINASAREKGDVDFVHDVATLLPSQVVGELMGLPREDWHQIQLWAEMNTSGQDPDIVGRGARGHRRRLGLRDERRRHHPHGDVRDAVRRPAPHRGAPRRPHLAHPRRQLRRRPDERPRVRHLLRAARHRRATTPPRRCCRRACSRCSSTPSRWPKCAPIRHCSPVRSRRSCATRTRSTTSGAPPRPTPCCTTPRSPRATRC